MYCNRRKQTLYRRSLQQFRSLLHEERTIHRTGQRNALGKSHSEVGIPPRMNNRGRSQSKPNTDACAERVQGPASGGNTAALAISALGIVFGDNGTSPLYAIDRYSSARLTLAEHRKMSSAPYRSRSGPSRSSSRSSTRCWCCAPTMTAKAASSPSMACCIGSRMRAEGPCCGR